MANEADALVLRNANRDLVKVVVPDLSGNYATQTQLGSTNSAVSAAQAAADQAQADANTAITNAAGAQATADGKVTTFFTIGAPTAEGVGDLWIDTNDGNKLYRWSGSAWVGVQDAGIATAISNAATAQSTADGKIVSFYQTTPPSAGAVGDLWVDTDDNNKLYRWDGTSWVSVRDLTIAAAQADASTAIANAATAQSAANNAQATADGKVVTFFTATAPTAAAVGDLWINSTTKKLSRWDGSTWVDSQDTQIGTALSNAANAQATADGKIVTFYQTSPPTAVAVGDLWVDTDDNNRLYRWSGSAWVSIRDGSFQPSITGGTGEKLFHNVLSYNNSTASLAGNIVIDTPIVFGNYMCRIGISGFNYKSGVNDINVQTGFYAYNVGPAFVNTGSVLRGSMPVTVRLARKIATGTVSIILASNDGSAVWQYPKINIPLAEVGHSTPPDTFLTGWSANVVAEASLAASYDTITTPPLRDTLSEITGAQNAASTAQTTADGKNTVFYATTAPTANKVNDLWFDTSNGNKPYKWSGSAWVDASFGDGAISGLNVGKLIAGQIAAGQKIIAGPSGGTHAELDSAGFHAFVDDPLDGTPNEVVRIGSSGSDTLAITDATGNPLASLSSNGFLSSTGASINATSTDANGNPTGGLTIYGQEFLAYLDALPKGVLSYGIRNTRLSAYTTTETPYQELQAVLQPGRSYRVMTSSLSVQCDTAGGNAVTRLRYTTDGTTPGVTSTLMATSDGIYTPTAAAWWGSPGLSKQISVSATTDFRVVLTIGPGNAAWGVNLIGNNGTGGMSMWIEDIGPLTDDTGIDRTGGTPPATKKTYVKTYQSTSSGTYRGTGVKRTDTSDVVQGYDPSGFNGDGDGLWIFPSMLTDLSGATVNKVEVYAYANHWYYNAGGTALIKVHGYTAAPASSPSMTTCTSSGSWPNPGGRWVTLPSSFYAGFGSGTYRGFGMGPSGGSNETYYGRFNGGTGALIRVTYTK